MESLETLSDDAKYQFLAKTCDYVWISSRLSANYLNNHILKYLCRTKANDIKIYFTEKFQDWNNSMEIDENKQPSVEYDDTDDEKQEEVPILQSNLTEDDVLDAISDDFNKVIMNIPIGTLLQNGDITTMVEEHREIQDFLLFNMEDSSYWSFSNDFENNFLITEFYFFECIKMAI